jgi:hypothetical protein
MVDMKEKYSINEEVSFLDTYIFFKRPEHIEYFVLKRGKIIDCVLENETYYYTVDPWASGHYGHKCFKVPENFLNPSEETIENCKKIAPVKSCNGWRDKH